MRSLTRHLHLPRRARLRQAPAGTTFCDSCGSTCTPACRVSAQRDRARTAALRHALPR